MLKLIIAIVIIIFIRQVIVSQKKQGQTSADSPKKPIFTVKEAERTIIDGIDYTKDFDRDFYYFSQIIHNLYGASYTIEEHVPMHKIVSGAVRSYKKADFLLSKNGYPVLVIDISNNKHSHPKAKELCNRHGIKHLTFYSVYENKESYLQERIDKILS